MIRVDLFAEDLAHELVNGPLIARIAREEHVRVTIRPRSTRGGIGAAERELVAFQREREADRPLTRTPDLLCVAIDGNCIGHAERRRQLEAIVRHDLFPHVAYLCPDPHVERWMLLDPEAFARVVGGGFGDVPQHCERDLYKRLLKNAVEAAGWDPAQGGLEFALK